MSATPIAAAVRAPGFALRDFVELTKPRITLMVVLTALVGYVMGSGDSAPRTPLLTMLFGTGLVAAGASALNMILERHRDALMLRTRQRPLPAGRLHPAEALAWGLSLSALGVACLWLANNPLAAMVALLTLLLYVLVYTPLKPITSLATVVGAVPGALPPVIGWAAARNAVEPGALVLFVILFLWQLPHFLAIAWLYRDDYRRGGFPMLPVLDPDGAMTSRQAVMHTVALVAASLAPVGWMAGRLYLAGALLCGAFFLSSAVWAARQRTLVAARGLFVASLVYLVGLCSLLLADRL